MRKRFKGVIKDWHRECGSIEGICVAHVNQEPMSAHAVLHDGIVSGERMRTSAIVTLSEFEFYAIVETRNGYYVLIEPRQK